MTDNDDSFRPRLTIVGGQPRGKRQKGTVKVPVGMEKLLFHAAKDEGFRKKLLSDRQAAIAECGIALRPSEEATLKVISNKALETMIANLVPENPRRRKFMGLVAAAAASLAAGTAGSGCVGCDSESKVSSLGINPDDDDNDDNDDDDNDTDIDAGGDTETETEIETETETDTETVDTETSDTEIDGATMDASIDGSFEDFEANLRKDEE
jgi:hypothetical protein